MKMLNIYPLRTAFGRLTAALCLAFALLCGTTPSGWAQTVTECTLCIVAEADGAFYLLDGEGEKHEMVKGENICTFAYTDYDGTGYGETLTLCTCDEANDVFTAVDVLKTSSAAREAVSETALGHASFAFAPSADWDGAVLYVSVAAKADLRTAHALLTVEDASKVRISAGGNELAVQTGAQSVAFNPSSEATWLIGPAEGVSRLGGVTHNGQKVTATGTMYYVNGVADGDEIEIKTTASTEPVHVSVTFADEASKGLIQSICQWVDYATGAEYEGWADGFDVAAGTQIAIVYDASGFDVKTFTVNGVAQTLSAYGNVLPVDVVDDTEIFVQAEPYAKRQVVLDLTDPAHVVVGVSQYMYSMATTFTDLVSGEQSIEISDDMPYITIQPADGCLIDRVATIAVGSADETEVEADYNGYSFTTEGLAKIIVVSHEPQRTERAVLWVDDVTKVSNFIVQRKDYSYCISAKGTATAPKVQQGYQDLLFSSETDLPLCMGFYQTGNPNRVYRNGAKLSQLAPGTTSYYLQLTDGDVVKVFLSGEPESVAVTFEGFVEGTAGLVDRITPLTDFSEPQTVMAGTEFSITVPDVEAYTIYIYGTDAEEKDGTWTFVATGDVRVEMKPVETSVGSLLRDAGRTEFYTISGRRLTGRPTQKGVYVVNGRKVVL